MLKGRGKGSGCPPFWRRAALITRLPCLAGEKNRPDGDPRASVLRLSSVRKLLPRQPRAITKASPDGLKLMRLYLCIFRSDELDERKKMLGFGKLEHILIEKVEQLFRNML